MKIVVSVLNGAHDHKTLKLNMEDEASLAQLLEDIEEFLLITYEEREEL